MDKEEKKIIEKEEKCINKKNNQIINLEDMVWKRRLVPL